VRPSSSHHSPPPIALTLGLEVPWLAVTVLLPPCVSTPDQTLLQESLVGTHAGLASLCPFPHLQSADESTSASWGQGDSMAASCHWCWADLCLWSSPVQSFHASSSPSNIITLQEISTPGSSTSICQKRKLRSGELPSALQGLKGSRPSPPSGQ
jgi:hypothetical protein